MKKKEKRIKTTPEIENTTTDFVPFFGCFRVDYNLSLLIFSKLGIKDLSAEISNSINRYNYSENVKMDLQL